MTTARMGRIGQPARGPVLGAALALALSACRTTAYVRDGGAESARGLPSLAEKTDGMDHRAGFFDVYLDQPVGKVWLALPPAGDGGVQRECLYVEGLATGLGSNPVGLDRGQLGEARLVRFRRIGGKILLEQPNLAFRARTERAHERTATRESFATSVLWAGPVVAADADGTTLVDFTSFVVRDAHGIARTLRQTGQGSWSLDESRSAFDASSCLAFPDNVELEALLTFCSDDPGRHVRATAPTPGSVTLVQHHSLLRLPDDGYAPRAYDPRAGAFSVEFLDYAADLDEPVETRFAVRHRLHKSDPSAGRSRPVEPIVYYVDRGAPEPVRSALIEGASWWADAFDAAGFEGAFRVELLPEDAHPLDARYNVIQWVHRSTRGWSYGGGVVDPRTGEMIKGHVSLGSLRVRQDRLLFEGLAGAAKTGSGDFDDPVELALARIRQLSAHEVGHTLGLSHNFAASTYGRASVMDYPAPLVALDGAGELDFEGAYAVGVGSWDRHAIRHLYSQFATRADERAELDAIVREGVEAGLLYLSDGDARPAGAAHPLANLWDNGTDPAIELERVLEVRRVALARFGAQNVAGDRQLASLEEVLAPLYFHHRYQLDAALKAIGGLYYAHARPGDGNEPVRVVPAADQRRALAAVLAVLDPSVLDLSDSVLGILHPRPPGYGPNRELFASRTSPAFDALGAAATAARAAIDGVLQHERCARLVDYHRRDPSLPSFEEVLDELARVAIEAPPNANARLAEIQDVIRSVALDSMIRLAANETAPAHVRSRVERKLSSLNHALDRRDLDVQRFLDRGETDSGDRPRALPAPPGSPIGARFDGCGFSGW